MSGPGGVVVVLDDIFVAVVVEAKRHTLFTRPRQISLSFKLLLINSSAIFISRKITLVVERLLLLRPPMCCGINHAYFPSSVSAR